MATTNTSVIHFETQRDNKNRWVSQAQLEGSNMVDWITNALNQRCYDYNVRAIRTRENKPHEKMSGKPIRWLKIAAMIATRSVNSTDICADLEISRNSFTRDLADMERTYGFVVEYVRHPKGGGHGGWYEIRDWGVLDEQRVIEKSRAG